MRSQHWGMKFGLKPFALQRTRIIAKPYVCLLRSKSTYSQESMIAAFMTSKSSRLTERIQRNWKASRDSLAISVLTVGFPADGTIKLTVPCPKWWSISVLTLTCFLYMPFNCWTALKILLQMYLLWPRKAKKKKEAIVTQLKTNTISNNCFILKYI